MIRGFETVNKDLITKPPQRQTKGSAGYDFFLMEDIQIWPNSISEIIVTNVKAYMQDDEVLELHIRSSLGFKKGVTLANSTGIIDSDYYNNPSNDGVICAKLFNHSDDMVNLKAGDAFMQGIFKRYLVSDNGNMDVKRQGGIGSTS